MGVSILLTVRKAAKLAVYVEVIMRVKNHQKEPKILAEVVLGCKSPPVTHKRLKTICECFEKKCLRRHDRILVYNRGKFDQNLATEQLYECKIDLLNMQKKLSLIMT